jgi:hypothetical protein
MEKVRIAAIVFQFLFVVKGFGDDGFRSFSSSDGRAIEAKIVAYNGARNVLQIERRDGKSVWLSPALFSVDDPSYLLERIHTDQFLDRKNKKKGNYFYLLSKQR